jgi:peptidoglycan/LPS O-acetylase OafA/YrhL
VAVLLVVLCHAGVSQLAGGYIGVDVFFVISGFLITGWILRHSERSGHVPFLQFYAARARRILPAAALTLVATTIACFYLLNFIRAQTVFHDSLWAAFFAANIHFASVGTNYFASSTPPSPLQHYWSLAVEEQFYLVWPALVMLILPWPTRRGRELRRKGGTPFVTPAGMRRLTLVLGLCVVASLFWSIRDTATDPTAAYFSTLTRAWELGIGGLVAVTATQLARIPRAPRAVMTWLGLAGVIVAAMTFSSGTAFPGYAALLPVLSAAFIIIGGLGGPAIGGASVLLGRQPFRFIGDVSYSFYLWHWPVLIIAAQHEGRTLSAATNVLLLAGAFALSVVTYLLYERPIHHGKALSRPWAGLSLWPVSIAAVVVTAVLGLSSIQQELAQAAASASTSTTSTTDPGSPTGSTVPKVDPYIQAVANAVTPPLSSTLVPPAVFVEMENLGTRDYRQCITPVGSNTSSDLCTLGAIHASRTVVIFGDSHAQMWLGDLNYFGLRNNWKVIPLVKEGCVALLWSGQPDAPGPGDVLGAPSLRAGRTAACAGWQSWAMRQLAQIHPDAIIVGTAYAWGATVPEPLLGYDETGVENEVRGLDKVAPRVIMLEDTPYWKDLANPVTCLQTPGIKVGSCTLGVTSALVGMYARVDRAVEAAGAKVVPTVQWFCTATTCPSVIDGTLVYRDTEHIAASYATYLEGPLSAALSNALGETVGADAH